MIVYRDAARREETHAKLHRCQAYAARGDWTSLLVELGELEQGVADALCPAEDDGVLAVLSCLRSTVYLAGCAFIDAGRARAELPKYLRDVERRGLPAHLTVKPPEGYVQYALDPAGYAAAARAYAHDVGEQRAARALVIGVRSIGTSLSGVVAASLFAGPGFTVRPRGATGSRSIRVSDCMQAAIRTVLSAGGDALIVDEGPGATGETFACVAAWLRSVGLEDRKIVVIGSRTEGVPLAPPERRAWFAAARKYAPPPDDERPARAARALGLETEHDLSGGRWRQHVTGAAGLPADPGHERAKFLCRDERGERWQLRYAGLGSWGEATVRRAEQLSHAGAGPEVRGAADGFGALRWVDGVPLRLDGVPSRRVTEAAADYVVRRARLFATGQPVDTRPVAAMLRENALEALGPSPTGLDGGLRAIDSLPEREAFVPDARLQPHEWVQTRDGIRKVDAIDHGDGLRLPGPTDLAWDLAGIEVELGVSSAMPELVRRVAAAAGDSAQALEAALAAYRAPYAALALGTSTFASWEASTSEDKHRHKRDASRYRALLEQALEQFA